MQKVERLDPERYGNIWAVPYYITPAIIFMILGSFVVIGVFIPPLLKGDLIFISGIMGVAWVIITLIYMLAGMFYQAYDIQLTPEGLVAQGMYSETKEMKYSDIIMIREFGGIKYSIYPMLLLEDRSGKRIYINNGVLDFGELVEKLLDRSPNVEKIQIDLMLKINIVRLWKKEPDMVIINRAKARAEENRKHLEQGKSAES